MNQPDLSAFIWSVADLLRGDYKQSDCGKVVSVVVPETGAKLMLAPNPVFGSGCDLEADNVTPRECAAESALNSLIESANTVFQVPTTVLSAKTVRTGGLN